MSEETSLREQISSLQERILGLQHALPESPVQVDLQRMQRALHDLQNNPPAPAQRYGRRPRLRVVQPTAAPLPPMTAGEATIWKLFADFHSALLSYSGGGQYLPREDWIGLANTAAEMTNGAVGAGTRMGRTDGTFPGPGEIGEVVQVGAGTITVPIPMTVGILGNVSDYVIVSVTLQPGDWELSAYITWDCRAITSTALWVGWAALSETHPPPETAIDGGTSINVQAAFELVAAPIMTGGLSFTVPVTFYLISRMLSPLAADLSKPFGAWGGIHARRMS